MASRVTLRPLALTLLVLIPIPLLALLCRGHNPSRLETINLPLWERQAPTALPSCAVFRLPPPPPGTVTLSQNSWAARLCQTNENRLLAGAERSGQGSAEPAGAWLEDACAWGRSRSDLSAKQDRVAARLMTAQDEDGFIGVRSAHSVWTANDTNAQAACLRGLLAYYILTRRPAAIYAALLAANRAMTEAGPSEALVLPLARLYAQTGDRRYLEFARHQAQNADGDALGECALYEATGHAADLQAAQKQWAKGQAGPNLTAELLLLTGRPGYAAALNRLPPSGPALARAAWTRAPRGVAVNTAQDSDAVFHSLHLTQRTAAGVRTITVQTPRPAAFVLHVFLPPGLPAQIRVNGLPQAPGQPGSYALLTRRWQNGDRVQISDAVRDPIPVR